MSDPPARPPASGPAAATLPGPAIDLERSIFEVLSSIPWEGPPVIDPDRTTAGAFFDQL